MTSRRSLRLGQLGITFIVNAQLLLGFAHWPSGDHFLPARVLNYLSPWISLGLVSVLAATWLIWRQVGWRLLTILLAMLLITPLLPLFTPQAEAEPATGEAVRVLSYNVCRPGKDIPAIVEVIEAAEPDLLLLQDVNPDFPGELISELFALYPSQRGYLAYDRVARQVIFSHFPLTSQEVDWSQGRAQKVVADTPEGPVMVWNVHASQPLDWDRHQSQFLALAEAIRSTDGPLIVAGDFNTTDQSGAYRMVTRYLKNAHWEAGWGFGFTFPAPGAASDCHLRINPLGLGPLMRIDHIFYSHHFQIHAARTLDRSGQSDHFPVLAELSFRE